MSHLWKVKFNYQSWVWDLPMFLHLASSFSIFSWLQFLLVCFKSKFFRPTDITLLLMYAASVLNDQVVNGIGIDTTFFLEFLHAVLIPFAIVIIKFLNRIRSVNQLYTSFSLQFEELFARFSWLESIRACSLWAFVEWATDYRKTFVIEVLVLPDVGEDLIEQFLIWRFLLSLCSCWLRFFFLWHVFKFFWLFVDWTGRAVLQNTLLLVSFLPCFLLVFQVLLQVEWLQHFSFLSLCEDVILAKSRISFIKSCLLWLPRRLTWLGRIWSNSWSLTSCSERWTWLPSWCSWNVLSAFACRFGIIIPEL